MRHGSAPQSPSSSANCTAVVVNRLLGARATFVALVLGTVAIGLAVHLGGASFGPNVRDVLGDALWAMMIAWWVGALAPHRSPVARAGAALAICGAVEASQLVNTPALDALRNLPGGHLILGSGFDPRDFGAYALGVLAAAMLERVARRRRS